MNARQALKESMNMPTMIVKSYLEDLSGEELLIRARRRIAQHASGRGQLDQIGPALDLRAHGPARAGGSIGNALECTREPEELRWWNYRSEPLG